MPDREMIDVVLRSPRVGYGVYQIAGQTVALSKTEAERYLALGLADPVPPEAAALRLDQNASLPRPENNAPRPTANKPRPRGKS